MAGKYRLIAEIGRGGMGSVWRAEHLAWKAPVAIKIMTREVTERPDGLMRFEREVRLAAGLRSPHVVQVLDHGIDDATQTPFIAMELLEGESLARRLKRVTRLSPPETFRIISHLVRALSRAHAAGIVHRDLKPDNVFLVRNEEESLAKVLDFGVAKFTSTAIPESGLTRPGAVLGTPFYMSPEQIQGSAEIDHRADLWSLAAITCECLTGRRPFEANDFAQLAVMLLGNTGRPLPSHLGPVPPGFDAWFLRATAPSIDARFQTARELAQALAPICGASSVSWAPDSFPFTEELPGGEPASMAGVSRTASRMFFKAGLSRPWSKLVASTLAALVVVGGGITVWQRAISPGGVARSAGAASGAASRAVLSATPAASAPPAPSEPPPASPLSAVRERNVAPAAPPGVRIATDDGAASDGERPVPGRWTDNAGELGEPTSPEADGASRPSSKQKPRTGKAVKAKPKRTARQAKGEAATASGRVRDTVSPPPPVRNANASSSESPGNALSVDGRRIRTSLTPTP